jgi:hypothetical protein
MPTTAPRQSFLEGLREAAEAARRASGQDPWEPTLRKLKGRIGHDGIERISTYDVFELGWTNIRARGLNPGSYRDRVRGYAREVPGHPTTLQRPNEF